MEELLPVSAAVNVSQDVDPAAVQFVYVVTTSHALLDSRGWPLLRHVYGDSADRNGSHAAVLVSEGTLESHRRLGRRCARGTVHSRHGVIYECGGRGWALAAAACLVSGHVDVGVSCKAERGIMMSAALFFDARFFTLTDDDVFWVLRPLHAFLSSQNADTKTAFGYFSCGERRGMDFPCMKEQRVVPLRRWLPKCFPVYALMSRAAVIAIQPFLEGAYLQVLSRQLHQRHDTPLGIALWLAGVGYSESLVPFSNEFEFCVDLRTMSGQMPKLRRCVAVHLHHQEVEKMHMSFDEAYRKLAESAAAGSRKALNISGGAVCRQASVMFSELSNRSRERATREFLQDCLLLELAPEPWASLVRAPLGADPAASEKTHDRAAHLRANSTVSGRQMPARSGSISFGRFPWAQGFTRRPSVQQPSHLPSHR
jgi:hypothetical protein